MERPLRPGFRLIHRCQFGSSDHRLCTQCHRHRAVSNRLRRDHLRGRRTVCRRPRSLCGTWVRHSHDKGPGVTIRPLISPHPGAAGDPACRHSAGHHPSQNSCCHGVPCTAGGADVRDSASGVHAMDSKRSHVGNPSARPTPQPSSSAATRPPVWRRRDEGGPLLLAGRCPRDAAVPARP